MIYLAVTVVILGFWLYRSILKSKKIKKELDVANKAKAEMEDDVGIVESFIFAFNLNISGTF